MSTRGRDYVLAPTSARPHYHWIDLAKAVSILLVVLNHALIYFLSLEWSRGSFSAGAWEAIAQWCMPLRLPLFFFATGLLAAPSLHADRETALRKRVIGPGWLYLVWATIFAVTIPRWPLSGPSELSLFVQAVRFAAGFGLAWYLWALPVLFVFGVVTRSLNIFALLAVAGLLALIPVEAHYSGNIMRCLVFYLIGLRVHGLAEWVTKHAKWRFVAAAVPAGAVAVFTGIQLFLDVAGVALLVAGCVLVSRRFRIVCRGGTWLARRTLPIYVLHFPLLTLAVHIVPAIVPVEAMAHRGLIAMMPVLLSAASVLTALSLHGLAMRTVCRHLFVAPRWFERLALALLARPRDEHACSRFIRSSG